MSAKLSTPSAPPVVEDKKSEPQPLPQRVTVLSELDSYIAERMKEQPQTPEELTSRVEITNRQPAHRLQLPHYFEQLSGDARTPGPYIFRWIFKDKRSVDRHLALGWTFVNRTFFPEMPKYLLSANGGVEIGDAILGFMPTKKALQLRAHPGQLSRERLKGQLTQTKPDYVMMTGNPSAENVYQPDLGPEASEESEEKVAGTLTDGRDF